MKHQEIPVRAGSTIVVLLFVLAALYLLSQIGTETRYSARGKLFAQPRFWPAVAVGGMVLFGVLHLARTWRTGWSGGLHEAVQWLRALEFVAWFMIYVVAVPLIGYLAATILFTLLLAFRMGYRRPSQLWMAVAMGIAVVVIFKAGLSVKIPGGAIYEYLPSAMRSFMIVNF